MDYKKIKRFWNDRQSSGNLLWREDLIPLNIEIVKKYSQKGDKILDLGCGNAEVSKNFVDNNFVTGVDFVDCNFKNKNFNFISSDVRIFRSDEKYDLILMFGLANFLTDADLVSLYKNCYEMMHDDSFLLVKHQSSIGFNKIVDGYSNDLKTEYSSMYRSIVNDIKLLTKVFSNVDMFNAYPNWYNKWPDTKFMLYAVSK